MAALSAYREYFPVPIPHPSIAAVNSGLDKFTLFHTARRVGLDTPHTDPVTSETIAE